MSINPDDTAPATTTTTPQGPKHLCDAVSILCEITGPHGGWCRA